MRSRQRAQVIVLVAVLVPMLFLPLIGLAIDAGAMFNARRDLQGVADGAARVGAEQIDIGKLRNTGQVVLNGTEAENQARLYIARTGATPDQVQAYAGPDPDHIRVVVRREVNPTFLRLLRIRSVTIRAGAIAQPCSGVVKGNCERP